MNGHSRKITFGIVLVLIGLLLLARTLGLLSSGELGRMIVAVSMIALGVYLILRRRHKEFTIHIQREEAGGSTSRTYTWSSSGSPSPSGSSGSFTSESGTSSQSTGQAHHGPSEQPESRTDGDLRYSKLFGDMFIDTSGVAFENIEVSAGVGDLELRLKGSKLNAGLNRIVISGFIGDVRIYVPHDIAYSATCSNFIGDIEIGGKRASGFGNNISTFSPDYDTASQKLYIAANSFIGDIRVVVVD